MDEVLHAGETVVIRRRQSRKRRENEVNITSNDLSNTHYKHSFNHYSDLTLLLQH